MKARRHGLKPIPIASPVSARIISNWPKDWDVEFKVHAPYNTTIKGVYRDGVLKQVQAKPSSRSSDIILLNDSKVAPCLSR